MPDLAFAVFVLDESMLFDIALVACFISAVTDYAVLIGDEEEVIVLLIIESGIDGVADYLADRPRRESRKLTGVERIGALELAYFQVDSVLLEDVAYRYV